MENILSKESSETLLLTNNVFNTLLISILSHFKTTHEINGSYKDSQFYGFGNYDNQKPNLKNDLELVLGGYVNGKYLYNKHRDAASGMPVIKISREYKFLFFSYLGYENIVDFIASDVFTTQQRSNQLELLTKSNTLKNYYYVCYYYGEDNRMTKGKVVIYNEWKTIEMMYVYENEDEKGDKDVYTFHGTITQGENFAYFDTKYYLGNKKSQGAKFIFFIGKSSPNERHYLIGTFSGVDKYDRAIAGKMILKKYNSKTEIEEEVNNKSFDPIICQELNKKRLIVESSLRKNPLLFSKKSPFAQVLMKTPGDYLFEFNVAENKYELKLKIEKNHYNIISQNDSIMIEDDSISILNKGQILNFDFSISGMFHLQKVSFYIYAIDFTENKKEVKGNFNGVDIHNNIVSGNVIIEAVD